MLSECMHASVPYAHAEGIQNAHFKNRKNDAHDEHAHKYGQFLTRTLSAPVPDPYAQHARKEFNIYDNF